MNAILNALRHPVAERLGWGLLHLLWQGAAIAVVCAIALWLLRRRSANARYLVTCAGLLLMPACLIVTFAIQPEPSRNDDVAIHTPKVDPSANKEVPAATPALDADSDAPPPGPLVLSGDPSNIEFREPKPAVDPQPDTSVVDTAEVIAVRDSAEHDASPASPVTLRDRIANTVEPALPWIVGGWFIGLLTLSVWHVGGWISLRRLRRVGVTPVEHSIAAVLGRLCDRLGIRRPIALLQSSRVTVPSLLGFLKPVILLPGSVLTGLTPRQLEAVLAHELAHVRRHDYLLNLLQTAIETLLFFHPAVWWVSRRIRVERENCCDDLAMAATDNRLLYAQSLTRLEELRRQSASPRPSALTVAASGGSLLDRICRVLGTPRRPMGGSRTTSVSVAGLLSIVAALVFLLPGVMSETPTVSANAAVAPGDDDVPSTRLGDLTALHVVPIADLKVGATVPLGNGEHRFDDIPDYLKGRRFTRRNGYQGILRFRVEKPQQVYFAVYGANWGGGGNSSGGWRKELVTRVQLEKQGWKEAGKLVGEHTIPDGQKLSWIVFTRQCKAGESFAVRTHKYQAPILFSAKKLSKKTKAAIEALEPNLDALYVNLLTWNNRNFAAEMTMYGPNTGNNVRDPGHAEIRLTKDEAKIVVRSLADGGYFDRAMDRISKPAGDTDYILTVSGRATGKHFREQFIWNERLFQTLDILRTGLTGKAASAMDDVLRALKPQREKLGKTNLAKRGNPVNGLRLTLTADKNETTMLPDGSNARPVKLKLTFTNVSKKPIKLNAYQLGLFHLKFDVTGPDAGSIRMSTFGDIALKPPAAGDFPVIQPGRSWSQDLGASHLFPGLIAHKKGFFVYEVRKPGTYKLRYTYDNAAKKILPHAKGTWTGSVASNEIVLTVRPTAKAAKPKPAAKPIDLGKNNFKVEVNPADKVPGGLYAVGSYRIAGQAPDAKTLYDWRLKKKAPAGSLQLVGRMPGNVQPGSKFRVVGFSRSGNRITAKIAHEIPAIATTREVQSAYFRADLPQTREQSTLPPGTYDVTVVFELHQNGKPFLPKLRAKSPKLFAKPLRLTCRFVIPAKGFSAELKKLADAAIAVKPNEPFQVPIITSQRTTGLDLSRILKLTGQDKDRANFPRKHQQFAAGVNALVSGKKTWALCSLLDHSNIDAKILAAGGLGKLADPNSVPALLAAAKRNSHLVAGSEGATLHSIYRGALKSGLTKITGLQLTPRGLKTTTYGTDRKPRVVRSEDNPEFFTEDVDFPKVDGWLRTVYLAERTVGKPAKNRYRFLVIQGIENFPAKHKPAIDRVVTVGESFNIRTKVGTIAKGVLRNTKEGGLHFKGQVSLATTSGIFDAPIQLGKSYTPKGYGVSSILIPFFVRFEKPTEKRPLPSKTAVANGLKLTASVRRGVSPILKSNARLRDFVVEVSLTNQRKSSVTVYLCNRKLDCTWKLRDSEGKIVVENALQDCFGSGFIKVPPGKSRSSTFSLASAIWRDLIKRHPLAPGRHTLEVNFSTFGAKPLTVSLKGLAVEITADDVQQITAIVKQARNRANQNQIRPVPEKVVPMQRRILKQLKSSKDRGTLRDLHEKVHAGSSKRDQLSLMTGPKPKDVTPSAWFNKSLFVDPNVTADREMWLLYRSKQLDDLEVEWIERIERKGNEFTITMNRAVWSGNYTVNITFHNVFGVNLGKLPAGKYSVKWVIRELTYKELQVLKQPRNSTRHWPKDAKPVKAKPVQLSKAITVHPARKRAAAVRNAAKQPAKRTAKDNPSLSHAAAVAAIKRLGGIVTFDTKNPDKQATGVRLDRPHFIDAHLAHLKGLTSLWTLDLTNSKVTDAGLVHLKGLARLQVLRLNGTKVTDVGLLHLKQLKSLQTLDLTNTQVTDAGLKHLKGLMNLQTLDLTNANFTGAGLEHLKELRNLQELHLTNTKVANAGLEHLKGTTSLRGLHLHGTKITDAGLVHLKRLKSLKTLILDSTKVTDTGLVHLKGLTSLKTLHLHGTQVTDAGLVHLKGLQKLERLVLNATKVTDAGLVHLKALKSLKTLYLIYNTTITNAGLVHVEGMTNLETLALAYTGVTDAGLEHLYALPKLRTVYLSNTKVTGAGVKALQESLPKCNIGHPSALRTRAVPMTAAEQERARIEYLENQISGLLNEATGLRKVGRFADAKQHEEKAEYRRRQLRELMRKRLAERQALTALEGVVAANGHHRLRDRALPVRELRFDRGKLTVHQLAQLAAFSQLERLTLRGAKFPPGSLKHLSGLSRLKKLDLGWSSITDADFVHFKRLGGLEHLDLEQTSVTGSGLAHLKNSKKLETLKLQNTRINDSGIAAIAALRSLKTVDFNATGIGDSGLAHIKGLRNLRVLNLRATKVTDAGFANLQELTNLRKLTIEYLKITGDGFRHLEKLKSLEELHAWGATFDDPALSHLKTLKNLRILALNSRISDVGLSHLSDLTGLQYLSAASPRITDKGLVHLKKMKKLNSLTLPIASVTDAGLIHLKGLVNLRAAILSTTKLTDAGLIHLYGLKNLRSLNLSGTKVTLAGLKALQSRLPKCRIEAAEVDNLNALKVLGEIRVVLKRNARGNVNWAAFAGTKRRKAKTADLRHLSRLPDLETLNLQAFEGLRDGDLFRIARLKSLRSLRLPMRSLVTDEGVKRLARMTHLKSLGMGFTTNLTDACFGELAGMTHLEKLDLGWSKMSAAAVQKLANAMPKTVIRHNRKVVPRAARKSKPKKTTSTETKPTDAQINNWAAKLSSAQFQERVLATTALIKAGKRAIPAVTAVATGEDTEGRFRATRVLLKLLDSADLSTTAAAEKALLTVARSKHARESQVAATALLELGEKRLRGVWTVVSQRRNGKAFKPAADSQLLFLQGAVFSSVADATFGSQYIGVTTRFGMARELMTFDCPNHKCAFTLAGDALTICVAPRNAKTYPQNLVTRAGDNRRLIVLKRNPPRRPASKEYVKRQATLAALKALRCEVGIAHRPSWLSNVWLSSVEGKAAVHLSTQSLIWVNRGYGRTPMLFMHLARDNDAALELLKELPHVNTLRLSNTRVRDKHLKTLTTIAGLKLLSLNLSHTAVTDAGMVDVAKLRSLTDLNLSQTNVGDAGVARVSACMKLQTLRLWGCKMTDRSVPALKQLNGLKLLDLSGTAVSKDGLQALQTSLPNCRIVPPRKAPPEKKLALWGRVMKIDRKTAMVWINLGAAEGLQARMRFRVYGKPASAKKSSPEKGFIEVTRVIGPHLGEARISQEDLKNPIAVGDDILPVIAKLVPPPKPGKKPTKKARIRKIDRRTGLVWIDVGAADGILARTQFRVHGKPADAKKPGPLKGVVEVTRITGKHLSEARITQEDLKSPIAVGDELVFDSVKVIKQLKGTADRGTLRDAYQKLRGGKSTKRDELQHSPPIDRKPKDTALEAWFDSLKESDFQLTANDDNWLLFRSKQLNDNDRQLISRIERRENTFVVHMNRANWKGEYGKNATFHELFGVNLGKLPAGKYKAIWRIGKARFEKFDKKGWPTVMETVPGKTELTVEFTVVAAPARKKAAAEFRSRRKFALAMAKIKEGMTEKQALAILGKPDDIRTEQDGDGISTSRTRQIWRYGTAGHLTTATLGRLFIDENGKVQYIVGKGTPPPAELFTEPQLRQLLRALDAVPSYNNGSKFNPRLLIRAVNMLQPLGKKRALAAIDEYDRISSGLGDETGRDGLFLVLRVLFDIPAKPGHMPRMLVGAPFPPSPKNEKQLPRFPVVMAGNIPFLVVSGYSLAGRAQSVKNHIEYFRKNGTLREDALLPSTKPFDEVDRFMNSARWPYKGRRFQDDGYRVRHRVLEQVLRLLDTVHRVKPRGWSSSLLPFGKAGTVERKKIITAAAAHKIRWDEIRHQFTFPGGKTLPPLPRKLYKRHLWKPGIPGLQVEFFVKRENDEYVTISMRESYVSGAANVAARFRVVNVKAKDKALLTIKPFDRTPSFGFQAGATAGGSQNHGLKLKVGERIRILGTLGKKTWLSPVMAP